jgi:hypothetical protein
MLNKVDNMREVYTRHISVSDFFLKKFWSKPNPSAWISNSRPYLLINVNQKTNIENFSSPEANAAAKQEIDGKTDKQTT